MIQHISAGAHHLLAVTQGGEVIAFGANTYGQLGVGHSQPVTTAVRVLALNHTTPKQAAAGHECEDYQSSDGGACAASFVVTSLGEVYSWGRGPLGRAAANGGIETSASLPTKIALAYAIRSVSAGATYSLAVTTGGVLLSWGALGNMSGGTATPQVVPALEGIRVRQASAGSATHWR